jgi:transcription antitermination factor NusG
MPRAWFAIETWPRYERKIANQLAAKAVEGFLPVQRQLHQWSDRRRTIDVPLFPNYVFVRIFDDMESRLPVLRTDGVRKFVGTGYSGTPIREAEIESIRGLLREGTPLHAHPYLHAGQRVRIRGGSLDGIEGVLSAGNDGVSFVVSIDLIQRSLAVKLRGYQVEAA